MPAYEITWTAEFSTDEVAQETVAMMRGVVSTVANVLPAGKKMSVKLARIMEEK